MPRISLKYKYFAANLVVLWLGFLFYRTNHYYLHFLSEDTQRVLLGLGAGYTLVGLVYFRLKTEVLPTHAYIAIVAARRWLKEVRACLSAFPDTATLPSPGVSTQERISLLFLLLKLFYLPMMIEFIIANWGMLVGTWWSYSGVMSLPRLEAFNNFLFPCLIDIIFITECAFYAFGYAVESGYCKNVVKSIEPTFLGWAVTLACYPPFNGFVNNYASWFTSDEPIFSSAWLTCAAKCAALLCFGGYLWGAISLGAKCSNLTNRGIVTTGAFSCVRHPAYAAKNLAWWIALLPVLSIPAVLSMAFWSFLYFLRAITEERHLGNDPEYREYCKKVRWRFIPGIF
jgi:protein-S-isoprenylcysteine O-methyltransferase Ste14